MATTKNVLAIVGGISIAALILKSAADKIISNVVVTPGKPVLDNTPFSQGYLRADIPVTIENFNLFPLGLKYFTGIVSFGEVELAHVNIGTPFTVPAMGVKTITLNMDIPIATVFDDILALFQSGNIWNAVLNKIELNGELQVQGNITKVPIPLNNVAIPIV